MFFWNICSSLLPPPAACIHLIFQLVSLQDAGGQGAPESLPLSQWDSQAVLNCSGNSCELATANNRCLHFCSERASSQRWVFIQTTGIYHGDGHGYSPNTRALATQGGAVRTESSEKQVQGTHTVGIARELKSSERTKYSDTYESPSIESNIWKLYLALCADRAGTSSNRAEFQGGAQEKKMLSELLLQRVPETQHY